MVYQATSEWGTSRRQSHQHWVELCTPKIQKPSHLLHMLRFICSSPLRCSHPQKHVKERNEQCTMIESCVFVSVKLIVRLRLLVGKLHTVLSVLWIQVRIVRKGICPLNFESESVMTVEEFGMPWNKILNPHQIMFRQSQKTSNFGDSYLGRLGI